MAKIDENFAFDIYRFLHRPIRTEDAKNDYFVERYLIGPQTIWEGLSQKIMDLKNIIDPEHCREDLLYYLKDIVGLTRDLRSITDSLSAEDLRKVILLAVPLWKQKGLESGFKNTIRLFTGFNARVYNWFDYRMIIGEKAIGEEQLGEDSWLISRPGVEANTPLGTPFILLQFNEQLIKDGSIYVNPVIPYGAVSFHSGGPFSSSQYNLKILNGSLEIPNRVMFDFTGNWTLEFYFRTGVTQVIPLFYKWDAVNNIGIQLIADTTTDQITYRVADGTINQTSTIASGLDLDDANWKHIVFEADWDEGSTGKFAIWINGTRIIYDDINGGFVKNNIANSKSIIICDNVIGGTSFKGYLDGIRFTNDIRYNVALSSITPPVTNFVEYVEEQLDEFQIDVRVVDDGTLDRSVLKSILNLMRPCSERINILYIDFFDDYTAGKGQWSTQSGSAYVEQTDNKYYFKLPPLSLEHVDVQGSSSWKNYIVQNRVSIYSGNQFEVRFLIVNSLNYYSFRVDASAKMAYLEKVIAGTPVTLASPVQIDIEIANLPLYQPYYVYMVSVFKNEDTGLTSIKCYLDSNVVLQADDNTYSNGTFGLYTYAGTTIWASECEMFQLPLEYDRINPNDEF